MPTDAPIRVLIADDEAPARQRLADLLAQVPTVEIVEQAEDGAQAVDAIRRLAPDLVFLDVQMPGLTGVEVVQQIGPQDMPTVIFVTAYDEYALKAFDLAAVDYLLKPFDDDRFTKAFARARQSIAQRDVSALADRLTTLLKSVPPSPEPASTRRYLERVAVEMRGQVRVVPVHQIDFITASGPYAELHVGEQAYVIRERMQTLEDRLDPDVFFRLHRSAIVRLDQIDALLYGTGGDYAVRLKDGKRLKVSRNRREELEQRLGLDVLRAGGGGSP